MRVGFVGGGKMGEAMLAHMVNTRTVSRDNLIVADLSEERRHYLSEEYGVHTTDDAALVISRSDVVFLSVKPQSLDVLLERVSGAFRDSHLVISTVAGKHLDHISTFMPEDVSLIRVMPNLPAQVSEGISAFCCGPQVSSVERTTAELLLGTFGSVVELPEEQFDTVTALSGSGPAFFSYVVEVMVKGAEALGISRSDARSLAIQTMLGTAKLLREGTRGPEALIAAVSSKGGTTEAGMAILRGSDVEKAFADTLLAAAQRSKELRG